MPPQRQDPGDSCVEEWGAGREGGAQKNLVDELSQGPWADRNLTTLFMKKGTTQR